MSAASVATFVLVHGGGHGGWCYNKVSPLLRAAGHEVYTPTLTGLGERRHLLTASVDLETHVTDVVNVLEYEELTDVILAGHSYGGIVITGVADRVSARIRHLVYLDAVRARNGESLVDVMGAAAVAPAQSAIRTIGDVELGLWPEQAGAHYGVRDPADFAWMMSKVTPHPWKTFTQKLRLDDEARVRRIPRTAVNCTSSLQKRDESGRARQLDADFLFELDTGHDLMINEPRALADILICVAEVTV